MLYDRIGKHIKREQDVKNEEIYSADTEKTEAQEASVVVAVLSCKIFKWGLSLDK